MQIHILAFEGPDGYARAGGLASRVEGLSAALAALGLESHLWFVGDPGAPGHERREALHLHRWCQWLSAHHPGGVYDNEESKHADYSVSLPPFLMREQLEPYLLQGGRAIVLAEEWHTAQAVLHLHSLLQERGLRGQVSILWNANNLFGFERVPWEALRGAARITTVSRYMKQRMREWGVEALVVANGLPPDAFDEPDRVLVQGLRRQLRDRTLLTKIARWDPDKRWLGTIAIVAEMKAAGWRPLLVARGGAEEHGHEVLRAAAERGLRVVDRFVERPGEEALLEALAHTEDVDVVNLISFVDPLARRFLLRGADVVLANSEHEPFGLVGLETMAVGGVACTGCSGEDYVIPGHNALVQETDDPRELLELFRILRSRPSVEQRMRRDARSSARHYEWPRVVERVLLPRARLQAEPSTHQGPSRSPASLRTLRSLPRA
jgi:glycosyltransferase involved in cell wall biosynthesis